MFFGHKRQRTTVRVEEKTKKGKLGGRNREEKKKQTKKRWGEK